MAAITRPRTLISRRLAAMPSFASIQHLPLSLAGPTLKLATLYGSDPQLPFAAFQQLKPYQGSYVLAVGDASGSSSLQSATPYKVARAAGLRAGVLAIHDVRVSCQRIEGLSVRQYPRDACWVTRDCIGCQVARLIHESAGRVARHKVCQIEAMADKRYAAGSSSKRAACVAVITTFWSAC